MVPGARTLAPRHLSVRVPWHDSGWNGTICAGPSQNAACLALMRTREARNDSLEDGLRGNRVDMLPTASQPPCIYERATFMSPHETTLVVRHPYAKFSDAHRHFAPTELRIPAYSAGAIPYRWMLAESGRELAEQHGLDLRQEDEQLVHDLLGFQTSWIQEKRNQQILLDTFFSAIEPQKSLTFFYAKRTPLSDAPGRAIVGIGTVLDVRPSVEYDYSGKGRLHSMLWERVVAHSIRPGGEGFLLPYHALLAPDAEKGFDLEDCVAWAPDDAWDEFSYGSEHVSHDTAVATLLSVDRALGEAAKHAAVAVEGPRSWVAAQINRLWQMRGPCPGLGAALEAFGLPRAALVAMAIERHVGPNGYPWPAVDAFFRNPAELGVPDLGVDRPTAEKWAKLPDERRALLKLLARFRLTPEQAARFYDRALRERVGIKVPDHELIENPYLLHERDRGNVDPVSFDVVDRGAYPIDLVREPHPLPTASRPDGPVDPRRVRALLGSILDGATAEGHTLLPERDLLERVRARPLQPACPVDADLLEINEQRLRPSVTRVEIAGGGPGYQLQELSQARETISRTVRRRQELDALAVEADWPTLLDTRLGPAASQDELETRAREEKAAALAVLAGGRFSVLVGPAGTGKTTLLATLCSQDDIARGGVLLLAPTGKARVRLERSVGRQAQTIAQFLLRHDRFHPETGRYYQTSAAAKYTGAQTVIVDEASMLTEVQLAATLEAVSAQRIVLVGDPRQLPPIGAGRPFVDIVNFLAEASVETRFPRVGKAYAELTVRRRTVNAGADLELAEWFGGQALPAHADEIWSRAGVPGGDSRLELRRWDTVGDLPELLLDTVVAELGLVDRADEIGFEEKIGGGRYGDFAFFHMTKADGAPGAGAKVEGWQILSPLRGQPSGATNVNRLLQETFRAGTVRRARKPDGERRIPKPAGPEQIVYGDKVIAVRNQRRTETYPANAGLQYVANGEIGSVVGAFRSKNQSWMPTNVEVEFSSQTGVKYTYRRRELDGDTSAIPLELAYAITVHKAQGSEFGTVILVVPNPCRLLSRELIYTALTRQQARLVILHQGDLADLRVYTSALESETARRYTNLFAPPRPVAVRGRFYEKNLIHLTERGDCVRSKSELVIADKLLIAGLDYAYERPLRGADGKEKYPDFTIVVPDTGETIYWEHLGMLGDPEYRRRWGEKLEWYRDQGILPIDDGRGRAGVLITSEDDGRGGLDSGHIAELVRQIAG